MKAGKPKSLRDTNSRNVLDHLRHAADCSVPEIAAAVHLSTTTVIKIMGLLVKRGIVTAAGKGASTGEGGKKPDLFRLNERYRISAGIHISARGYLAALGDLKGSLISTLTGVYPANSSVADVVAGITSAIRDLMDETGIGPGDLTGIAVAVPGIVDRSTGSVLYSPWFPSWGKSVPLGKILIESLGFTVPWRIDNEFRFQVTAERTVSGLSDRKNVIVIGGGEGLGSGIMANGTIARGTHDLAGEIGHMVVNPGGELCSCGGRGCFEAMVFRTRLLEMARSLRHKNPGSMIYSRSGPDGLEPSDIFDAAGAGDPLATTIMDDIIGWFAVAINNLIVTHDPEVIIIHGIYTGAGACFISRLQERLRGLSLPDIEKKTLIRFSSLGKESGVTGAVMQLGDEYFSSMIIP